MDTSIESIFFTFLSGEISLAEFARWVYANGTHLQEQLSEPFYLALIAFNYKAKNAGSALREILKKNLPPARYENWRLTHLLHTFKGPCSQEQLFELLHAVYEEAYGLGNYEFLKRLGIQYVVLADYIPAFRYEEYPRWNDGSYKIEEEVLKRHQKYIRLEAQKISQALKQDKIQITGKGAYLIEEELEKELLSKEHWNIVPPLTKEDTKLRATD